MQEKKNFICAYSFNFLSKIEDKHRQDVVFSDRDINGFLDKLKYSKNNVPIDLNTSEMKVANHVMVKFSNHTFEEGYKDAINGVYNIFQTYEDGGVIQSKDFILGYRKGTLEIGNKNADEYKQFLNIEIVEIE
jgi:hypothetical protein